MGLLGIGGIVYIAILPFVLSKIGIPAYAIVQYTIANSIFSTFLAAFWGTITLIRQKNYYGKEVVKIGAVAVMASLLALKIIVHSNVYSVKYFNTLIILVLLYILFRMLRSINIHEEDLEDSSSVKCFLTGLAGGILSSLGGVGGGVVMIPILNLWLKINIKKAKAISIGVIFFTSLGMSLINLLEEPIHELVRYSVGYIIFPVVIPIMAGVLLGAPFGVKVGKKISPKLTTIIFASFILCVIIRKVVELFDLN